MILSRLGDLVRVPLYRNGYSLVFSSVSTSGLGVLYWILAARLYPTEVVGLNTAVISTINLLANLAQLNQVNALNRFLPVMGRSSLRFIITTYLISAAVALVAGLIFLGGVSFWAPTLGFLAQNPLLRTAFLFSIILWVLFVLQDGALTGLRQAMWVPVVNILFAVAKIILLIVFASLLPAMGIAASWMIPLGLGILIMSFFLFIGLVPNHVPGENVREAPNSQEQPVRGRQIIRYVAGDFFGSLFFIALVNVQPIIVNERLGASANAYFYLPWQFAYALFLVSRNMGMSLIAEAAVTPGRLNEYSFRVLKHTSRMIVPAVAIVLLGAPYFLLLFGQNYAQEGTLLLRLLSLSAIPQMIIILYVSIARSLNQIMQVVYTQAAQCLLTLVFLYLLIDPFGVSGIGMAWLVSQSLVALVLLATRLRKILLSQFNLNFPIRIYGAMRTVLGRWNNRRQIQQANSLIPRILQSVPNEIKETWVKPVQAQQMVHTVSDVTVITLGNKTQAPAGLLKLANSKPAEHSLNCHKAMVEKLRSDPRIADWGGLLPNIIACGTVAGKYYLLEGMLPGMDARRVIDRNRDCAQVLDAAARAIAGLHRRTTTAVEVDRRLLNSWVDDRLYLVGELLPKTAGIINYQNGVSRVRNEIYSALDGKKVPVGWIHGDYMPGNFLVSPEGNRLLGIIDWDLASAEDLPPLDLVHLIVTTRMHIQKREMGEVLRSLLNGEELRPHERSLLESAWADLPGEPINVRILLLLSWLRHITGNITKTTRFANHWLWVSKNVEVVLENLSN